MQIFIPFDPQTLAAQLRSIATTKTPEAALLITHAANRVENGKGLLAVHVLDDDETGPTLSPVIQATP